MDTALTLFGLADLTPDAPLICGWCKIQPATTRVYAIQNLLGVQRTELAANAYRDAFHRAHSGPCCVRCAWGVAGAWWGPVYACPERGGSCHLWTHTFTEPRPGWGCTRHHHEATVVWFIALELAA